MNKIPVIVMWIVSIISLNLVVLQAQADSISVQKAIDEAARHAKQQDEIKRLARENEALKEKLRQNSDPFRAVDRSMDSANRRAEQRDVLNSLERMKVMEIESRRQERAAMKKERDEERYRERLAGIRWQEKRCRENAKQGYDLIDCTSTAVNAVRELKKDFGK